MAGTVNKVTIIGALGKDPEIRSFQNGGRVANFSVATSESWKDKATGEKREETEWHRVSVFNEHLIKLCENYLAKGVKVYVEGQLKTRKYEKDGRDVYTTEIVLKPYRGEITILDFHREKEEKPETHKGYDAQGNGPSKGDMDDEIPF